MWQTVISDVLLHTCCYLLPPEVGALGVLCKSWGERLDTTSSLWLLLGSWYLPLHLLRSNESCSTSAFQTLVEWWQETLPLDRATRISNTLEGTRLNVHRVIVEVYSPNSSSCLEDYSSSKQTYTSSYVMPWGKCSVLASFQSRPLSRICDELHSDVDIQLIFEDLNGELFPLAFNESRSICENACRTLNENGLVIFLLGGFILQPRATRLPLCLLHVSLWATFVKQTRRRESGVECEWGLSTTSIALVAVFYASLLDKDPVWTYSGSTPRSMNLMGTCGGHRLNQTSHNLTWAFHRQTCAGPDGPQAADGLSVPAMERLNWCEVTVLWQGRALLLSRSSLVAFDVDPTDTTQWAAIAGGNEGRCRGFNLTHPMGCEDYSAASASVDIDGSPWAHLASPAQVRVITSPQQLPMPPLSSSPTQGSLVLGSSPEHHAHPEEAVTRIELTLSLGFLSELFQGKSY